MSNPPTTAPTPALPLRIGVVGGTFDPIHLGHTAMAEWAADCARLDRVLLVPAAQPPHRSDTMAPADDRLEMCRLAVAGRTRLEVSDLELRRPGPSYTVDTLRELRRSNPDDELFLVLGWDAASQLGSWQEPDEVLRLARLVIVTRPGFPEPSQEDLRAAGVDPDRALRCGVGTPDIEATDVRRLLEAGKGLDGLIDPSVAAYIRRRDLYARTHNAERVSGTITSKDLADLLVASAESKKAWDPVTMDLRGKTTVADYFVVCDGETDRQLRAIADEMIERAREAFKVRPLAVDGYEETGGWILVDFDSVIAHIFLPGERSYYDLESLWTESANRRKGKPPRAEGD